MIPVSSQRGGLWSPNQQQRHRSFLSDYQPSVRLVSLDLVDPLRDVGVSSMSGPAHSPDEIRIDTVAIYRYDCVLYFTIVVITDMHRKTSSVVHCVF